MTNNSTVVPYFLVVCILFIYYAEVVRCTEKGGLVTFLDEPNSKVSKIQKTRKTTPYKQKECHLYQRRNKHVEKKKESSLHDKIVSSYKKNQNRKKEGSTMKQDYERILYKEIDTSQSNSLLLDSVNDLFCIRTDNEKEINKTKGITLDENQSYFNDTSIETSLDKILDQDNFSNYGIIANDLTEWDVNNTLDPLCKQGQEKKNSFCNEDNIMNMEVINPNECIDSEYVTFCERQSNNDDHNYSRRIGMNAENDMDYNSLLKELNTKNISQKRKNDNRDCLLVGIDDLCFELQKSGEAKKIKKITCITGGMNEKSKNVSLSLDIKKGDDTGDVGDYIFVWLASYIGSIISVVKEMIENDQFSLNEGISKIKHILKPIIMQRFHLCKHTSEGTVKCTKDTYKDLENFRKSITEPDIDDDIIKILDSPIVQQMYVLQINVYSSRFLKSQKESFRNIINQKKESIEKLPNDTELFTKNLEEWIELFNELKFAKYNKTNFYKMHTYFKTVFCIYTGTDTATELLLDKTLENLENEISQIRRIINDDYMYISYIGKSPYDNIERIIEKYQHENSIKYIKALLQTIELKQQEFKEEIKSILKNCDIMKLYIHSHINTLMIQCILCSFNNKNILFFCFHTFKLFLKLWDYEISNTFDSTCIERLSYKERYNLCSNENLSRKITLYILFGLVRTYLSMIEKNIRSMANYRTTTNTSNATTQTTTTTTSTRNSEFKKKMIRITELWEMNYDNIDRLYHLISFIASKRKILKDYIIAVRILHMINIKSRDNFLNVVALQTDIMNLEKREKTKAIYNYVISLYKQFFYLTENLKY